MSADANSTPNLDRAIWIEGQFNEALLKRLRPEIIELTAHDRHPITVFKKATATLTEPICYRCSFYFTHYAERCRKVRTTSRSLTRCGSV